MRNFSFYDPETENSADYRFSGLALLFVMKLIPKAAGRGSPSPTGQRLYGIIGAAAGRLIFFSGHSGGIKTRESLRRPVPFDRMDFLFPGKGSRSAVNALDRRDARIIGAIIL